ncbi:SGNH/GDSL hydrolase family protein [Legionella waltersii]|uniref:Putative thermolabile hemolysin n=1 Tax=Legionella waltersii TaxID=66969 RepID=A0A0W1ABN3_9GAMM|nr:SGNH/GDSL hydrolase family protein [Legionella waltersii]KTD78757.1 putative thermolabile hemolysin [Legionella waltersii]SNV11293.1 thermolabile hemolysin [Legionella waltersii]
MPKRIIRRKIFMGDSLSDRGTLDHLKLAGFIPMSLVSGLSSKSPRGRFTNGFLWIDMVGASGIEQLEIDHWRYHLGLKDTPVEDADLADLILAKKLKRNREAFTLDDDKNILFNGARYIRTYCEGGATSADWKEKVTIKPANEGARLVVSNLADKREQLLNDDQRYKVSDQEKAETLVTEWSGANDLITVNSRPSREIADEAVKARIANIEAMIGKGYRNFVLMNLPDLGLTPRYVRKGGEEQENASDCSKYFNQQLAAEVKKLQDKYQDVFLDVFDVSSLLTEVYQDPEKYKFKKELLSTPYTESEAFKKNQENPQEKLEGMSPSEGYMFWDDVHPTADMHAWLAEKYMEKYDAVFDYRSPTIKPGEHSVDKRKEMKKLKDELGLIVPKQFEEMHCSQFPADENIYPSDEHRTKINTIINKIDCHCQKLENGDALAKSKGKVLRHLLDQIYGAKGELSKLTKILNRSAHNDVFNIHRNPKWDRFWQKNTTRTQDELRELVLAVDDALNEAKQRDEESPKVNNA